MKRPSTAPSREASSLIPNGMQTLVESEDGEDGDGTPPTLGATCSTTAETYDWPTFVAAYALGRWDPHKIPNPPRGIAPVAESPDEFELTAIPHRKPTRSASTSQRLRSSFSSASAPPPVSPARAKPTMHLPIASSSRLAGPKVSTPSSIVSAATLRLAGSHVNLSPLALPSPEHELTDPMRGVSVVVPGVHPDMDGNEVVMTPGGTRKVMLKNFWKPVSQEDAPAPGRTPDDDDTTPTATDYFSILEAAPQDTPAIVSSSAAVSPKRVLLTRQTSAPLPVPLAPAAVIGLAPGLSARDSFADLGYLAPPMPPDEDRRRRALHKFNLWGTASDVNFDRIAHLAKLVFNTKGVHISLLDTNEQYFKSEWGIKVSSCKRRDSFCGHAILQRDDEPTVILDTALDWRFSSNPMATGSPRVRFYAGAPLRTSDGYNVGTLAVIDDSPREDFTPRHRHTLKEFAAIAMREMELWRDKIQIKVRDRIQQSMEQFSRECIEIDMEQSNPEEESDHAQHMTPSPMFSPVHTSAPSTPVPPNMLHASSSRSYTYSSGPPESIPQNKVNDSSPSSNGPTRAFEEAMITELAQPVRLRAPSPTDTEPVHVFEAAIPGTPIVTAPTPETGQPPPSLTPPWTPPSDTSPVERDSTHVSFPTESPSSLPVELPSKSSLTPFLAHTQAPPETPPNARTTAVPSPASSQRPSLKPRYSSHQHQSFLQTGSMEKVYSRAARLIQHTLDVDDVIVMDVSHCDVNANTAEGVGGSPPPEHGSYHSAKSSGSATPGSTSSLDSPNNVPHLLAGSEGSVSVAMYHGDPAKPTEIRKLGAEQWATLGNFLEKYPEGKVMDSIVDKPWRAFLPTHVSYALTVPIFNIDKRPFALLCAYNAGDVSNSPLEGHELSYLRAIGVIILSAVLKRRMILADKAKSLFISNISHELRTPLHGILAAAELLDESSLSYSQSSFLQTIQACGTSLVETVNHVLDFTKLSGNSKSGGVENAIVPSKVNLMQLVEEAVDGCWVGHRARQAISGDTGIGSVYAPPQQESSRKNHVETVIEIGYRQRGWLLNCEKGGIRRILMNLFGNSLKFTTDGCVHVSLREVAKGDDDSPGRVKVELSVLDTGKGISRNFQRNQLFHPFSQENPLQPGTGLGLAIVNSIIRSDSVDGRIDVWSEENVGTEIKVTFNAEETGEVEEDSSVGDMEAFKFDDPEHPYSVSLVGFDADHRGVQLLAANVRTYLSSWWGFEVTNDPNQLGDIVILNEDVSLVAQATQHHDTSRPFIVLSDSRGSPSIMSVANDHERIGGFCRMVYKPGGPSRLRSTLSLCVHALKIQSQRTLTSSISSGHAPNLSDGAPSSAGPHLMNPSGSLTTILPARRNTDDPPLPSASSRPAMARSVTINPTINGTHWRRLSTTSEQSGDEEPETTSPTITVGPGGTLLRSSVGTIQNRVNNFKILVVEDNPVLRNLLLQWLSQKGYQFRDAADGRDGVNVYTKEGPFDVVLLDMSMPVLDGVGATEEIRQYESEGPQPSTKILALTGMSSLEDKRRAFDAGVDGYLVKPFAFKTLDEMFHKLGMAPAK